MGDWRVPALPNKRFEPTPRACMLTPEVVERLSVFNFGLIISQLSERTTKRRIPKRVDQRFQIQFEWYVNSPQTLFSCS
jgi:hypothetical protein